jgi:hypothetical protein
MWAVVNGVEGNGYRAPDTALQKASNFKHIDNFLILDRR